MKQNFTVRLGALDRVEAFLRVAQHHSFRRAAAELGVTPSAVSEAVRALEARVGAALFIRTARSVRLTEAGEQFFLRAKPAFEELVAASEVARELGQRPAGLLRLRTTRRTRLPHVARSSDPRLGLPTPFAKASIADGRLRAVLMRFAVTTPGVFLYYPGRRQVLPKLRAFIEHLRYRSANASLPR